MDFNLLLNSYIVIFLAGGAGAFFADVLKDNCIIMPEKIGKIFNLGFIGGILIGGLAGCFIDGSLETAFMGGFMGKEIITRIILQNSGNKNIKIATPTEISNGYLKTT